MVLLLWSVRKESSSALTSLAESAGPLFFCFQRERGTRRKGNIELWDWIESMVDELGGQKGLRWHESIQNESQENGG